MKRIAILLLGLLLPLLSMAQLSHPIRTEQGGEALLKSTNNVTLVEGAMNVQSNSSINIKSNATLVVKGGASASIQSNATLYVMGIVVLGGEARTNWPTGALPQLYVEENGPTSILYHVTSSGNTNKIGEFFTSP